MLKVGDRAPVFKARPVFGYDVDVAALTAERPLAICFMQHSNSPLARRDTAQLQEAYREFDLSDIHLVAITPTRLRIARDFVPRFHLLFRMIADPEHQLFDAYQVGRAGKRDALKNLKPSLLVETARHLQQGFGPDALSFEGTGDQLPAQFVIAPGGALAYVNYGRSITDPIDVGAIISAGKACQA